MPLLTLTKLSSTHIEFHLKDDNDNTVEKYAARPLIRKDQKAMIASTGLGLQELLKLIESINLPIVRGNPKPTLSQQIAGPLLAPTLDTFQLRMRGLYQSASEAKPYEKDTPVEVLREVFAIKDFTFAEPVLEWQGTDRLACLDVDYHGMECPLPTWRKFQAGATKPTAVCDHLSHGGGVKLYYVEHGGFRADELAAVAAIHWLAIDGRCKPEIKSQSRHPLYTRPSPDTGVKVSADDSVNWSQENSDVTSLSKWFGRTVDEGTIKEWLDEQGYKIGDRLEHNYCPIHPGYSSHGTPVYIGDFGIHCHSCESAGRTLGGRKPGFASYAKLLGSVNSAILAMVKKFCHWEHARIVLQDKLKLPEHLLKLAYAALLKMFHGAQDPRIAPVFMAGKDLVRQLRRWTTSDGVYTYLQIAPMLSSLPATQVLNAKNEAKPIPELVARFGTGCDLATYGYPAISPLMGCKIYGHHLDYPDERILYPVPHRTLAARPPKYLKSQARHTKPWDVVERFFPGINQNYLKLLMIQKGFVEGSQTQAPFILVAGPTKAGKSTTIHVAASICGDHCTDLVWTADHFRLRQGIYEGRDNGTFVAVNEVFKEAKNSRVSPVAALDPILNLTEDSTSHQMYIGSRSLDRLPALVCTDIEVPNEVRLDRQLSRRFVYVSLGRSEDWEPIILQSGIGKPGLFRAFSEENALVADTILSEVIDEFFSAPLQWSEAAGKLGFLTLEKAEDWEEGDAILRRFFELVAEAAPLAGNEGKRYPGRGWVAVRADDGGALGEIWSEICGVEWNNARRCKEVDWSKLLKSTKPITFDIINYKPAINMVRFRVGSFKSPDFVNGQCF